MQWENTDNLSHVKNTCDILLIFHYSSIKNLRGTGKGTDWCNSYITDDLLFNTPQVNIAYFISDLHRNN